MIVLNSRNDNEEKFLTILSDAYSLLCEKTKQNPEYYISRTGNKLEVDVYEVLNTASEGTDFEGGIELISGQRFPDIVAYLNGNGGFGVEVKTTIKNHWRTTGSSIFEGTRVDGIDRIYLLFAKLVTPIEYRYRKYEECLYDVAVTHSPRYLIDMMLGERETIFDKADISYDELRLLQNPFQPIKKYYREVLGGKLGDVWWIDRDDEISMSNIAVRLLKSLDEHEKQRIMAEAMILFPVVFAKGRTDKYEMYASWLVAKYGVVTPNARDPFSAGGKQSILVSEKTYEKIPRVFLHLQERAPDIIKIMDSIEKDDIEYYWRRKLDSRPIIDQWFDHLEFFSKSALEGTGLDVIMMFKEAIS